MRIWAFPETFANCVLLYLLQARTDGALLRFENVDLLIFRLSNGELLKVSLNDGPPHKSPSSDSNPIMTQEWTAPTDIQLISAVPTGKLLALKYFPKKGGNGECKECYCLLEFNLIIDGKANSKKVEK